MLRSSVAMQCCSVLCELCAAQVVGACSAQAASECREVMADARSNQNAARVGACECERAGQQLVRGKRWNDTTHTSTSCVGKLVHHSLVSVVSLMRVWLGGSISKLPMYRTELGCCRAYCLLTIGADICDLMALHCRFIGLLCSITCQQCDLKRLSNMRSTVAQTMRRKCV